MPRRYLFGPVTSEFAAEALHRPRQDGTCLAFDPTGQTDLAIETTDTWEAICGRLPQGWTPDFFVLDLHYTTIPSCLWSAPVPLVGLAMDWNLQWHSYRRQLRRCDLVLTDTVGVETLAREGLSHARVANLYGCGRSFLELKPPERPRDIDVLFVGNLQPAVQRERLPWLARLARLAERWRVVLTTDVFGDDYRALLARARIVFNRSIRGECNMRAFEAAAAGALLFQEGGNREVPAYFRDRQECVYYTPDNLEELLHYYLEHEEERRVLAEAARTTAQRCGFEGLWEELLKLVNREWEGLQERARRRCADAAPEPLLDRCWQALGSNYPDPTLVQELTAAVANRPESASLHNALGLAVALVRRDATASLPALAAEAVGHFRRATEAEPSHVLAALNLAEAFALAGQTAPAVEEARQMLALLDQSAALDPAQLEEGHFPPVFDHFRVEWERAAWANAGQPAAEAQAKRNLLRWRAHELLAELTGDLAHAQEAASIRPDLPTTRLVLGALLLRADRAAEAIPHFQEAVAANPFDRDVAELLRHGLRVTGDTDGLACLARERRLLARAAPDLVAVEPWFGDMVWSPSGERKPPRPLALDDLRRYRQGNFDGAAPRDVFSIVWEGLQLAQASYALVNRELCRRLIERGHELAILSLNARDALNTPLLPAPPLLAERFHRPLARPADVNVRHFWPPTFSSPPAGHFVLMQPWEYGSLPHSWVGPILEEVDEVWAYSHYVRDCYLKSGIPADRVHVVPLGVDPARFHPQATPLPLQTRKRVKFLFVGGTIARKGFDLLLDAYTQTFTADDNVCLVVKDMGADSFYRGQTAGEHIARIQATPGLPAIEYLNQPLTEEELPGLYTACDCLVHPYRGEGFGLPIAEAMACGLPVLVTGHGAALDFCNQVNAYLLPARLLRFPEKRVGDLETVDYPWVAEVDLPALRQALRRVVAHPAEARAKGRAAYAHIHAHFTWDRAVAILERRVAALRQQPIRRLTRAAAGHTPAAAAVRPATRRQRVSLAMIVKNEEANLLACLESVADLVDEIIIVDTGSTDRTKEVAARFGARVFDFAWVDNFAAARNESLRHVTGDFVFWLDADDRLDEENRQRLRALFASLTDENVGFVMKCLCLPELDTGMATVVDHVRLFRHHPDLRWEYRVHEQILGPLRRLGADIRAADVVIHHTGYQDPANRPRKVERDIRLLRLQDQEWPGDPFVLFNLGSLYSELNRPAEALSFFRQSLKRCGPTDSIVRKLFALIVYCHRQLGQHPQAVAACREGLACCPDDVELLFTQGRLLRERGDLTGAAAALERLLHTPPPNYFASVDAGLRGYKARHLLGQVYRDQGRAAEAEAQWRAALAEQPDFGMAWLDLGQLYLAQGRWDELEQVAQRLGAIPQGAPDAAVLRAHGHLARREFAAARRVLEEVVACFPQLVVPRQLLAQVLLQEGKDWGAAERALRDVLALDPGNAEARHNLEVLLRQTAGLR